MHTDARFHTLNIKDKELKWGLQIYAKKHRMTDYQAIELAIQKLLKEEENDNETEKETNQAEVR